MNCKCGGKIVDNRCEWCGYLAEISNKSTQAESIADYSLRRMKETLSKKLGKPIEKLFPVDVDLTKRRDY